MAVACGRASTQHCDGHERHQCIICKKTLQEAIQLRCGCRVCKKCGDSKVTEAGLFCPGCKKCLDREKYLYFEDRNIRKEIEIAYNSHSAGRCTVLERPNKHGSTSVSVEKGQIKEIGLSSVGNGKVMLSKESRIQQESIKIPNNGRSFSKISKKIRIHQEQLSSTYCGECYSCIYCKDLEEHRRFCWKLHLYNGKSFRSYVGDVHHSSVHITYPQQGGTNQPLVARTMEGILDGFSQLREVCNNIQDEVMKLRHDMQRRFTRPDSIDDPIFKTMKWKAENVSKRAVEGYNLLSRTFQSSPNGYNMCLNLEFYGDTFKVRLVLLRGDNDDNLQWPFKNKVIISVLSQRSKDVFEVPPIEPNVQRCRDSRGTVVCSMMSPKYLRPYIIDNCMFIQCTVI